MGINNWLELGQAMLGKFFDAAGHRHLALPLHFTLAHCASVCLAASLCLLLPVAVPVSGRIIRWLSAFALIYEESATSDHSISSSVGNTWGGGQARAGVS